MKGPCVICGRETEARCWNCSVDAGKVTLLYSRLECQDEHEERELCQVPYVPSVARPRVGRFAGV